MSIPHGGMWRGSSGMTLHEPVAGPVQLTNLRKGDVEGRGGRRCRRPPVRQATRDSACVAGNPSLTFRPVHETSFRDVPVLVLARSRLPPSPPVTFRPRRSLGTVSSVGIGRRREIEPALVAPGRAEPTAGDRDDLAVRVVAGRIGHDGTRCCGIARDVTVEIRQRPAEATGTRAHGEACPGRVDDRVRGGAGRGGDPDDRTALAGVRVRLGDPAREPAPVTTEGVEGERGRSTGTGLWGDPGQAVGEIIGIGRGPDRRGGGAGGTGGLGTRVAGAIECRDGVRVGVTSRVAARHVPVNRGGPG